MTTNQGQNPALKTRKVACKCGGKLRPSRYNILVCEECGKEVDVE